MTAERKIILSILCVITLACVILIVRGNISDQICPDARFRCEPGQTCCPIGDDVFGCCPYDDGVCCDTHSCCPKGYDCNNVTHSCTKKKQRKPQPFVLIELPVPGPNTTLETEETVMNGKKTCPDQKQTCPESYTCCAQATGGYGCCPLTGAICCADKVHCCPMGTQCTTTELGGSCA